MRTKPPANPLAAFINSKIPRPYKSRRAIARAIGMSDSGFSRAVKDPHGNLTVEQCLRLAAELGVEFATILAHTGRAELAAYADRSHTRTPTGDAQLSRRAREVGAQWQTATALVQDMVQGMLDIGQDVSRAVRTSRTASAQRLRAHVRAITAERRRLDKTR